MPGKNCHLNLIESGNNRNNPYATSRHILLIKIAGKEVGRYHWIIMPITRGISNRVKGVLFQMGMVYG